ncbi:unnamed protein product [Scytosiphon promiscuus]
MRSGQGKDQAIGSATDGTCNFTSSAGSSVVTGTHEDRVTAALEKMRQNVCELEAAIDDERAKAMEVKLNNPGHGAVACDQPILNLGQLKDKVANTMHNAVNDWIDRVDEGIPQVVLPMLFLECQKRVEARHRVVTSILFPRGGRGTDESILRNHMLNNHEELFLLSSSREKERVRDFRSTFREIGDTLQRYQIPLKEVQWLLEDSGLRVVADKYYEIIVHVYLQEPPATFSKNCGKKQLFAPGIHSPPVDGERINKGQPCLVAFPAILDGTEMWSPNFTLGFVEPKLSAAGERREANALRNPASGRGSPPAASKMHAQGFPDAGRCSIGSTKDHIGIARDVPSSQEQKTTVDYNQLSTTHRNVGINRQSISENRWLDSTPDLPDLPDASDESSSRSRNHVAAPPDAFGMPPRHSAVPHNQRGTTHGNISRTSNRQSGPDSPRLTSWVPLSTQRSR